MGNAHLKPYPKPRNRKQVHWKAAERPAAPGKPYLTTETEVTPDIVTIRWLLPISDGGSPISGYLVEHRRTGSPHWVRATPLLVSANELTLSGLEPGWRYQFRVSAQNGVGLSDSSEVSEPITVTLQRSAITAPQFTQELKDTVALETEKCEFQAHFLGQPAPKICWFKDGFEIFSSRRIRIITEHDKSILTIHQASLADEGEIKCTATNRAGHMSSKARLTIEAPPSIRLPRQYEEGLLFEIGETIRLKVTVAGRPIPLVFWHHNGDSIQNNDHYEIDYRDRSFTLKIDEATRSDRGEYQIKAVNKLGEDTASFLVTVTDKPSPPGKARVVMTLGRSVTLAWDVPEDDGGCKIGNYIVEYYRLGWEVWLKAATTRQLTTRLGDLIEGSEYKFRVKAESPYGVSDPSGESENIFIPDPKRGINQPLRGRSQPKDVPQEVASPVAVRRKKPPRSQSSSRVEDMNQQQNNIGVVTPQRPQRTKTKTPPKTPDNVSPRISRKTANGIIDKNLFDRSSMARELSYGSPEYKLKKDSYPVINQLSSNSEKSISISLEPKPANHTVYKVKIEEPVADLHHEAITVPSSSPGVLRRKSIKGHEANISGSSEFMLVLCPDKTEQDRDTFQFDESLIPPPLSLSAPELGAEPPEFFDLKTSASSSELLHERAMIRFYEAAEAEEAELEKRRANVDLPKIRINSIDKDDLERKSSLRRRLSAGGITQQQAAWAVRRRSLKSPTELLAEAHQTALVRSDLSADMKREIMMDRQRSKSEEKEEAEFERVRNKMAKLQTQSSFERKQISIAEEAKWMEEYEESMSESESSDGSEIYKFKDKMIPVYDSDEDETESYRPVGALKIATKPQIEPFEILTKRKEPPDPNFVPKPILKKVDTSSPSISPEPSPKISPPSSPVSVIPPAKLTRSLSPRPDIVLQRNRSKSLAVPSLPPLPSNSSNEEINEPLPVPLRSPTVRTRSASLLPHSALLQRPPPKRESLTLPNKVLPSQRISPPKPGHNISALAGLTAIAAAGVIIPQNLLNQKKDAEEAKVVIDHYSDIVRNYGQRRTSSPQLFLDRDALKKAASEDVGIKHDFSKTQDNLSLSQRGSLFEQYEPKTVTPLQKAEELVKPNDAQSVIEQSLAISANLFDMTPRRPSITITQPNETRRGSSVSSSSSVSKSSTRPRRQSKSPSKRTVTKSKSPNRKRAPTKSPVRRENWSNLRTADAQTSGRQMRRGSKSPSPVPLAKRRPMLREITTQTSIGLDSFDSGSLSSIAGELERQKREELAAEAKVKVRSAVDYATDLAMFAVACWLYLFSNELLAIPVLLVMVFRQLQDEVSRRIPKWILKKFKKKDKNI